MTTLLPSILVALLVPLPQVPVGPSVTMAATCIDNIGCVGVLFLVNDQAVCPEDLSEPWGCVWDTSGVPEGFYEITARGRDAAGNLGLSLPVPVVVDRTRPFLEVTVPPPGQQSAPPGQQ